MPSVTPADLTAHLNLPAETATADAAILGGLVGAATAYVEGHLGYTFDERFDEEPVPEPLRLAVLMLGAHWYEAREAATPERMQPLPYGVDEIITTYREWTF